MNWRLFAAVAAALVCGAAAAWSAPITGEISINGPDNYTATQVNFTGPGNLQGESGSFLVLGTCTTCVTMAASLTASSTETLFSVTNMGHSSSLMIQAPNTFVFNPNSNPALDALDVSGSGTLNLDGMSVAGVYSLTTQGPISTPGEVIDVTFSATAVPVPTPEPSAISFLLTGVAAMLGLRYWRRRRSPATTEPGDGFAFV